MHTKVQSFREMSMQYMHIMNWVSKIGSWFRPTTTETTLTHCTIQEECLLRREWEKEETWSFKNKIYWMSLCSCGQPWTLLQLCLLLWCLPLGITIPQLGMGRIHPVDCNLKTWLSCDTEIFMYFDYSSLKLNKSIHVKFKAFVKYEILRQKKTNLKSISVLIYNIFYKSKLEI